MPTFCLNLATRVLTTQHLPFEEAATSWQPLASLICPVRWALCVLNFHIALIEKLPSVFCLLLGSSILSGHSNFIAPRCCYQKSCFASSLSSSISIRPSASKHLAQPKPSPTLRSLEPKSWPFPPTKDETIPTPPSTSLVLISAT